jgi:glycerophosphoryl diester phosphodiesterase
MDPRFTADGVCVLHHDPTVNRTCRTADGKMLEQETPIDRLTFAQLRQLDAGLWFSEAFRGTKVPTLEEALTLAKAHNTHVKLDNIFARFPKEQIDTLFAVVERSGAWVGFTCADLQTVEMVVARFPNADIHYDGPVTEEAIVRVKAALKDNPLVVWIPADCPGTAWCRNPKATPELCAMIHKYAKLGIWIISTPEDLAQAQALGADIIETPGQLKP